MSSRHTVSECPYCKESIKTEALVCRHCRSPVDGVLPPHEGKCPWCAEAIKADALRCKHCLRATTSIPVPDSEQEESGADCGCSETAATPAVVGSPASRQRGTCGPCKATLKLGAFGYLGIKECQFKMLIGTNRAGVSRYRIIRWTQSCYTYSPANEPAPE